MQTRVVSSRAVPAASAAPRRATRAAASVTSRVTASTRPSASTAASRDTSRASARSPPARSRATTCVPLPLLLDEWIHVFPAHATCQSTPVWRARPHLARLPDRWRRSGLVKSALPTRDDDFLPPRCFLTPFVSLSFLPTCTSIPGRVDSIDRGEERFESNRGRRIASQS